MLAKRLVVLIMLATSTGCIQQTTSDSSTQFQYELWIPMSIMLVGIVMAAVGWQIRDRWRRTCWGILIFGLVCSLGFAPSIFLEKMSVTTSGFYVQTGLWGLTEVYDVKFDDVRQIRFVEEVSTSTKTQRRRGRKTRRTMVCEFKDGRSVKISADKFVVKSAIEILMQQAVARGVEVSNDS